MEAGGASATAHYRSGVESSTQMRLTLAEAYHVALHASQMGVSKRTLVKMQQIELVSSQSYQMP